MRSRPSQRVRRHDRPIPVFLSHPFHAGATLAPVASEPIHLQSEGGADA
jgi:hypothetical protein